MLETETVLAGGAAAPVPVATARGSRERLVLLGLLFTCTGATALLAEQVFEKLLSTLLGASTPAAATVLAVYFGGLTLGGLLYSRLLQRRIRRPLKAYAFMEGTVALWALLLYLTFDTVISVFAPFLALGRDHFWLLQLCRVVVAACWILPATVPMGASFPAIADALEQMRLPNQGRALSALYGCNLLGAILGAVFGPFQTFPFWGLDGTLLFVCLVNVTVSAIALRFAYSLPPASQISDGSAPTVASRGGTRLLIGIAFFSGLYFFSLEIVWTQLIATVIGNSVYAFAAMLAMVLIGLGVGALLTAARFPKERHIPVMEVGRLLLAAAIVIAPLSLFWQEVPGTLAKLGRNIDSFGEAELLRWTMAAVLLVPPAAILGMVYPSLFRLESFPAVRSGSTAGELVAANSIGSILGALATGFGLIRFLGSELTLKILTCLCAGLGLLVSIKYTRSNPQRRRSILFGAIALALALFLPAWNRLKLTSGKQVYFSEGFVGPKTRLKFFHEDTAGGFTSVVENPDQQGTYRTLLTNGKFQGNDAGEMEAQTAVALAPMMFVLNFQDGLNIGLGTGRTAFAIRAMGFRSLDVAEIARGIVEAADRWFPRINGQILRDSRTRLFLEDGRNVMLLHEKPYDLITMEISSVWFAGSTNLYSQEFFRLVQRRLKPGGVFQQWIQIHHIGTLEIMSAIATVRSVFPHVSFWVIGGQGIIVASDRPQRIQPTFFEALQRSHGAIGWPSSEIGLRVPRLVTGRLLASEDVSRLCGAYHILINTDRNRYFEYATPRYNNVHIDFATRNVGALLHFASFPSPEVSTDAIGPLAEAARAVDREQYSRYFGVLPVATR